MNNQCLTFGITMDRGIVLHKKGVGHFQDIWDLGGNDFLEWEDAHIRFLL